MTFWAVKIEFSCPIKIKIFRLAQNATFLSGIL